METHCLPAQTLLHHSRYAIEGVLGTGGFGITYLCLDQLQQRKVAVKEYFPLGAEREGGAVSAGRFGAADFQAGLRRFQREARVLAALQHPHIVRVHEFFCERETAYLVSEFVEGEVLASYHQDWLAPIVSALAAVHGQGLVHGDVKPANILVQPNGRPVLIDFGCSRPSHTEPTACLVSHGYSPPEQYTGQSLAPASDQYALAATWVHIHSGSPPPDALQRLSGAVLPSLPRAVSRALALDPQQRWPDLDAFLGAFQAPPELPAQSGWVRSLVGGANWLAAGGEDRQVRLWSTDDWQLRLLGKHDGWINALVLGDERLYSLGTDRFLHGYQLASGELLFRTRLKNVPQCAARQGDDLWIGDDRGLVQRVQATSGELLESWQAAPAAITCLAVWETLLACNGHNDRISLWTLPDFELLEKLKGHQGPVKCLSTFQDVLYSGAGDRRLLRWDWREGRSDEVGRTQGTPWAIWADQNGLFSADGAKKVLWWSAQGPRLLGEHTGEVRCLAPAIGGLAAAGQDGQIRLHSLPSRRSEANIAT